MFTASPDTVNIQDLRQRALAATGKFGSGKHDLSAFRNNLNTLFPYSSPSLRLITTDDPGSFLAAFLTSIEMEANWAQELTGVKRVLTIPIEIESRPNVSCSPLRFMAL
ncbi:MAG TPA: hypothetical protein HPP94_10140 [Desulfuromonadales bacterium]|nr:hypothetical protein [Desulfuromonadales bacterium]